MTHRKKAKQRNMNNSFENTETSIKKDVREVFEEIWQELNDNYFTAGKLELSYIRETIGKRLVTTLVNKNLLLMDTVLNYLAKDARETLGNTDSKVINQFYEWNQQQAEKFKSDFKSELQQHETVTLPTDVRVFCGGAGVAAAVISLPTIGLLLPMGRILTVPISLAIGLLTYKTASHVSSSWATKQLEEKMKGYLQLVEKVTLDELLKVVEEYKQGFNGSFSAM